MEALLQRMIQASVLYLLLDKEANLLLLLTIKAWPAVLLVCWMEFLAHVTYAHILVPLEPYTLQ